MARSAGRGLTLVELVIGLVVGAILGTASLVVIQRAVHSAVYLPNQARVAQAGTEMLEAMIEGNRTTIAGVGGLWAPGLRFSRQLAFANPTRVDYIIPTGQRVALANIFNTMIRFVFGVGAEFLPYYVDNDAGQPIEVLARTWPDTGETAVFRYYDGAGNRLAASPPLGQIRRIEIGLRLETGSGQFEEAAGSLELVSGVALRALQ